MKMREIRKLTGLSQAAFSEKYEIPKRTIEDWETEKRTCPTYVNRLLERAVIEDYGIRFAVADESEHDIDITFYDTLEEARSECESLWDHLTNAEKKTRTVSVVYIRKEWLTDEDDPESFDSYDYI